MIIDLTRSTVPTVPDGVRLWAEARATRPAQHHGCRRELISLP